MNRNRALPIGLAGAGLLAVAIGVHAELLHFRPSVDATITTGWGVAPGHRRWIHSLNHEEWLLAELAAIGFLGAVAATRWHRASVIPVLAGLVVCFYPVRAVFHYATHRGLYTGLPFVGDPSSDVVLGAEPSLLVVGGALLVGSGVVGWRATPPSPPRGDDERATT
ncbi:hypothetical protein ACFQJD_13830 [Haloplanus sp. GCM10025708]|uniref:hypothetical protein n=1 Tax=Haloferacaceae TaxID=1644056 RepID=UPI00361F4EE5